MKMGAVLESLSAPTLTVVDAQEGTDGEKERRRLNEITHKLSFFIALPPVDDYF